jgi:hypothetical protein
MSERATFLATALVSEWGGKDAIPSIAETIDVAITVRDEEWRAWLDKHIPDWDAREGHNDHPPPDRR